MHNVKILITGEAGTGKTGLAHAIADLLSNHNISNKVVEFDETGGKPSKWKEIMPRLAEYIDVQIDTAQARRNGL